MEPKERVRHDPTLTQEEREKFWRQRGWSPDLPDDKREAIEEYWTDSKIELVHFHGF